MSGTEVTVYLRLDQVAHIGAVEWHCPLCGAQGVVATMAHATAAAVDHLVAEHRAIVTKVLHR